MSRPVTRKFYKEQNLDPEPHVSSSNQPEKPQTSTPVQDKTLLPTGSSASTVSRNKSDKNGTVRSNTSSTRLKKREAELEATKQIARLDRKKLELERSLIQKELEVKLAQLDASESRHGGSSRSSRSRVQEWLSTEFLANKQHEPVEYPRMRCEDPDFNVKREEDLRQEMTNEKRARSDPKPSDIQLLAREIANLRRPSEPKELPYYNGNISEWLSFKAAVQEIRGSVTDNELRSRFRRCLKGEARITVAAPLDTLVPVSEIMEALELRFGLPELILLEEIQTLKDMPKLVDNTEQLSKFACKVRNCVSTIKTLNKPEHLFNIELLRALKQKIPHLKGRWISYAVEHEYEHEPELVKLSDFLKKEAQSTSKYWLHEPSRPISKPVLPNRTHYAEFEDETELEPEPCYTSNSPKDANVPEPNCLHCKSMNHILKDCDKFLRLSTDDRWEWAKETKVCFKCLKSRHRREYCRARPCGIDGCRMPHNRLLHSPTARQPETLACGYPSTSDPQVATEPAAEKTRTETAACSRPTSGTQVLVKIIPIEIRGPTASKRTYALLDGGSTLTLLKKELADAIGLTGTTEPLTLAGVNAISEEPDSERVNLEVSGPSNTPLELHGVRTVKKLPLAPQTVANIDGYTHLQDLPRTGLCYDHAVPGLLIGQDNWHAIVSREIRHGKRNEPVASLTALGWVVHGFSHSCTNAVHFVGYTEEVMHQLTEDYFKIDSLGVTNKPDQNLQDERALDTLQSTAKRVKYGKRWEEGLLWRENDTVMPNNLVCASERLQFVFYGQKYKENMHNLERADETWYKHCQSQSSSVEMDNLCNNKPFKIKTSRLWNLCSFIDYNGMMRLLGRASAASDINRNLTQPVILVEALKTVLAEAESTVNSHPLTHVSVQPNNREAITPNHILHAGPNNVPYLETFAEVDMITRNEWRRAQKPCDVFRNRRVHESLPIPLPRSNDLKRPALNESDVVVIFDPGIPRNTWPRGAIIKVFPGADGRVRVADVRTVGGVLRRPAA